jgi:exosortase
MKPHPMHKTAALPVAPSEAPDRLGHASQAFELVADEQSGGGGQGRASALTAWMPVVVLGALLVFLYERIGLKLVHDWYEYAESSHGFLIPFFVAFLLWDKREELRRTAVVPSWAGVSLVAAGLFELLVGIFGADLFLQRTSFLLLAAGLVWTFLGRAMLGRLKFVFFVALLAIPLPSIILSQVTFPLQLLASSWASSLLPLAGVPVLREGNVMQLPAISLEVAEACSGIRSLMSLFTVAVIYGYFLERATWRRVVLALASVPIAVLANVARVFGTGLCVQYWDPVKAMGFFHEFSGWLMFLVSMSLLYLVHVTMRALVPEGGRPA